MNTVILLLRNAKPVPDSLLNYLAAKDFMRGKLWEELESIKQTNRFPLKYKNHTDMARAMLYAGSRMEKIDSIVKIDRQWVELKRKKGYVYFFKFRRTKESEWQIALSGLQPLSEKEVSGSDDFAILTDIKIKEEEPLLNQFNKKLKQLIYSYCPSAVQFFDDEGNYKFRMQVR
jgi:hypothetical protein